MRPLSARSAIASLSSILFLAILASAAPASAFVQPEPGSETLLAALDAEAASSQELGRYLVVLDEPPLASYRGGIRGLAPTAVDTAGGKVVDGEATIHLDYESPAALEYKAYLAQRQERAIRMLRYMAPELDTRDWRYTNVLNGFAAKMTPASAAAAMRLDGIRLVYPAEELFEEMDSTKDLVGTVHAWEAAGGTAEAGLGARVAILEAGNATLHEFFHDDGMPAPPDGFPSAQVYTSNNGQVTDLLAMSDRPEAVVNNKIIGFRIFAESMSAAAMDRYANPHCIQVGTSLSCPKSGHGSHVSGTVGGRFGTYEIRPGVEVEMGGVAPNAWVLNYPVFGETPDMIKAFEVMAEEEIDAVNLSLGTTTWLMDGPETHPVSVAMTGAADAGVLVVGSSGNAGANGRTSLSGGWKYSEDLMVVGNTTSNGRLYVEVELEDAPEEISTLLAGLRGDNYPDPVSGELAFYEDGGCEIEDDLTGKIAVVERFSANGGWIGSCGYTERARIAAAAGASGILYIYYDRATGGESDTALAIPATAVGTDYGPTLAAWMRDGNTTTATMHNVEIRDYEGMADILASSSSRGPGIDWSIKPDISAPGTGIISSVLSDSNPQDELASDVSTWPAFTGTSMAAPHITGAAGLLRSMHPHWTVQQLRSALINTSAPVVVVSESEESRPADPTESGPGRVDLTNAYDPKAFLDPPKASFGAVQPDSDEHLEFYIESTSDEAITWDLSVEPGAGDAEVHVEPESIRLAPYEVATFTVHLETEGVAEREHWGDIVLSEREPEPPGILLPALVNNVSFGEDSVESLDRDPVAPQAPAHEGHEDELRKLRLVYYAYVDMPEERDDVFIVDWTYGETEDYTSFYTDALEELGLSYTIWGLGEEGEHSEDDARDRHPTFEEMYRHDLVILNANESQRSLHEVDFRGAYQYQNIMISGGSMLIAGQGVQGFWRYLNDEGDQLADTENNRNNYPDTWPYTWGGPSQNVGCEMCLARYFAGYTPGLTSTLSNRLLVPYPMAPDRPEIEVVLERHEEADGPFDYNLDISTGAMAKDGAAGNQYQFNSGSVVEGFKGTTSNAAADLGDVVDGMIIDRTVPYAEPLWSYPVTISDTMGMTTTTNVVGTYVAGQQHEDGPAWNAMYWGFGLEGVGKNGDDTASRSELLGDTFNFLALNMMPEGGFWIDDSGHARLTVDLGPKAEPVRFTGATIDWGDGRVDRIDYEQPRTAEAMAFSHAYGSAEAVASRGDVRVTLTPVRGEAAPVRLRLRADTETR